MTCYKGQNTTPGIPCTSQSEQCVGSFTSRRIIVNDEKLRDGAQPRGLESQPRGLESQPRGLESQPRGLESQPRGLESQPRGLESQPRGLESLTIYRYNYKDSILSTQLYKGSECWSGQGSNP